MFYSVTVATCPQLSALNSSTISYTSTYDVLLPGDKATYTCHSGFVVKGIFVRECLTNGTWSGMKPQCIGMQNLIGIHFYNLEIQIAYTVAFHG